MLVKKTQFPKGLGAACPATYAKAATARRKFLSLTLNYLITFYRWRTTNTCQATECQERIVPDLWLLLESHAVQTCPQEQFCSDLWSEQTCLISPVVYMELATSLPVCREVHSLRSVCWREDSPQPVCRGGCTPHLLWGKEEPVACHNKPCYWSPEPHRTEIQVSCLTDGNHTPRRVEKARGCLVWNTQVTCSYDLNRHMKSCNRKPCWPS